MNILAIDPGCTESAYVVLDDNLKAVDFRKENNIVLIEKMYAGNFTYTTHFAIEMIASYGMAVGKEVFDTCVWIGKFEEAMHNTEFPITHYIYRKDEKINLCGTMKAKDSNIIQALIDRFAYNVPNKGKGCKNHPGWFYGFSKDIWQAYAVGVTYYDLYIKGVKANEQG